MTGAIFVVRFFGGVRTNDQPSGVWKEWSEFAFQPRVVQ
jgi:hypothetical protein